MKNKVTFAAAGSGKTFNICNEAIKLAQDTNNTILLVTYTNEGVSAIEKEYRKQNCGVIDENVKIKTWYSFLLSDCIKPYQCLLNLKHKNRQGEISVTIPENFIKSIAFYQDEAIRGYSKNHWQYFINKARDVSKNRVSELACLCNEHSNGKVTQRLEEIYSHIFFDELQDYAGWDLEIFLLLFASKIHISCVGDYKQATFRTNNSLKNKQYRDDKIVNFFKLHESKGTCYIEYSNTTRRFNSCICDYINTIFPDNKNEVCSCNEVSFSKENAGVYIIDSKYLNSYCDYYSPVILRYNKDTNISFAHNCQIYNYGSSKGCTFERVVIIPVGTVLPFIKNGKEISSNVTKSKFYVACTRAKNSIVFAVDNFHGNENYKLTTIEIDSMQIPAYKYC